MAGDGALGAATRACPSHMLDSAHLQAQPAALLDALARRSGRPGSRRRANHAALAAVWGGALRLDRGWARALALASRDCSRSTAGSRWPAGRPGAACST